MVDGGEGDGGMGGEGEGGESRLGRGEKQILLIGVGDGEGSCRSSTLFLRFLGFLTGGGAFSGDSTGIAGGGAWTVVEAADPAGTGKMHDRDRVWRPAAWLKATRAFRVLAKHRSYSAVNSAAVTAGCCSGRVFFTALAPSPLATLAHVVARGEL
jgi:hypothetical protein